MDLQVSMATKSDEWWYLVCLYLSSQDCPAFKMNQKMSHSMVFIYFVICWKQLGSKVREGYYIRTKTIDIFYSWEKA